MLQTAALPTGHADLVTDVAYDFYGERIATGSADQKIKVWRKDSKGSGWELEAEWKAHDAPILRLTWSHPEFGNLLASCSYDRTVRIWEEVGPAGGASMVNGNSGGQRRWAERALLNEARGSVRGVEFGPNAFGLKLASISTDATLRIYTSISPTLTEWQLTNSISVPSLINTSSSANPTDGDSGISGIAGQSSQNSSTNSNSGSVAGGSGFQQSSGTGPGAGLINPGKGNEALGGWTVSWCKEKWWGSVLAVSSGHSGIIKIVSLSSSPPSALLILPPPSNNTSHPQQPTQKHNSLGAQAITSLSWAASCGRSYHLIASGHRDGTVRVWKIKPADGAGSGGNASWSASVMGEWGLGEATIGRVEWNTTGSILSVASEEGKVRLYKATYAGKWECMGTFSAEAPQEDGNDDGADAMIQE
ncbi:hypothetical protein FFLO_03360 [Filobasidium floriforme]|uniref:Uncharacterized protein n=1 Tax=Filobasidium floriforme TaxID=5210 RepID=A0A8K0JKV6_9TREE|nr:WD40 repeat-like protein [Filobasidium floriforme]KAG7544247.1 hypothetical protein FFLO_03360 [Filobasidium floriforme]KAH8085728.1 WD40 repeat-like protein [Filobasidium floriforme]